MPGSVRAAPSPALLCSRRASRGSVLPGAGSRTSPGPGEGPRRFCGPPRSARPFPCLPPVKDVAMGDCSRDGGLHGRRMGSPRAPVCMRESLPPLAPRACALGPDAICAIRALSKCRCGVHDTGIARPGAWAAIGPITRRSCARSLPAGRLARLQTCRSCRRAVPLGPISRGRAGGRPSSALRARRELFRPRPSSNRS